MSWIRALARSREKIAVYDRNVVVRLIYDIQTPHIRVPSLTGRGLSGNHADPVESVEEARETLHNSTKREERRQEAGFAGLPRTVVLRSISFNIVRMIPRFEMGYGRRIGSLQGKQFGELGFDQASVASIKCRKEI
jgi:hypothetical protein